MIPQELLKSEITGDLNGLPRFEGVHLGYANGVLTAFVDRPYAPWEQKEEVQNFPVQDLQTIEAVLTGATDTLPPEHQAILEAVANEEIAVGRQDQFLVLDSEGMKALETWARNNAIPEFKEWLAAKDSIREELPYQTAEVKK